MKTKVLILAFVIFSIAAYTFIIEDCVGQWEPDVRLTNASGDSFTSHNNAWSIAVSGTLVHVAWTDYRDGDYEIYYKRSSNGGLAWEPDTRLTINIDYSEVPSIAVSGTLVHVVWKDNREGNEEIYYKRSTDSGITWGEDTRLTNNDYFSEFPSIAVSGILVNVVWRDNRDGNWEIYYKRSTDGGIIWEADTRLTNNTADSDNPSIAVSGTLVNVVWKDYRDGNDEIYFKRSTNGGINWVADKRLTNNTASSKYPSIAVSDSLVNVVWNDDRDGNSEIYYKRSTDDGINWGADTRLTNNINYSYLPSIAVLGTLVHIVWDDFRDGNYEIYYKRSTDGGINWGADTRLTNNTSDSWSPSIAVSGTLVHVVWCDLRDGNYEIYYKRNPTGNVGIKNISTEIPSAFSLGQNYPNPFNAVTSIKFKVTSASPYPLQRGTQVVLKVFDLNGREIRALVNDELNPGTYEVQFDAGNLSSGIYFYRMETEKFSETRKLILLK